MAIRLGVLLSGLAVFFGLLWTVWALAVAFEWWLVILLYLGMYAVAALAVIWLGVLIVHVVAKAFRVIGEMAL